MPIKLSKFQGAIFGGYAGDALGFPVENCHSKECHKYIYNFIMTKQCETKSNVKFKGFNLGQYTDDSQLSREIAISYIENKGKCDYSAMSKRIADMFRPLSGKPYGCIVGFGKNTLNASIKILNGVDYKFSGTPGATTNGTAMRSSIFGIIYDSPDDVADVAAKQSLITHMSSTSAAAAVTVALFTHYCARTKHKNFNVIDIINTIIKYVRKIDIHYAECLTQLTKIVLLKDHHEFYMHVKAMEFDDYRPGYTISKEYSNNRYINSSAISSVMWAIYAFTHAMKNSSYVNCICNAICAGGDVDTIAKMAGSFWGAFNGVEKIPSAILKKLHDVDSYWNYKHLIQMTMDLFTLYVNDKITT